MAHYCSFCRFELSAGTPPTLATRDMIIKDDIFATWSDLPISDREELPVPDFDENVRDTFTGNWRPALRFPFSFLEASTQRGCKPCSRIRDYIVDCHSKAASNSDPPFNQQSLPDPHDLLRWEKGFFWNERVLLVHESNLAGSNATSLGRHTQLEYKFFVKDDDSLPEPLYDSLRCRRHGPSATPSGDTSSDVAIARLSAWLERCTREHTVCGAGKQSPLPRRVLLISEDGTMLSLVENDCGQKGRYACLSHRWGNDSIPLRLLRSMLGQFKENISKDVLPPLFQDAIVAAIKLGIQYLWIDSLCIIQDDPDDWHREAASMADIYENSYLTLAATACGGSSEPMFRQFSPPEDVYVGQSSKGKAIHISQTWKHLSSLSSVCPREEVNYYFPLLSRGWVYQERLLSPRVIHFTQQELVWECKGLVACECRYDESEESWMKHTQTLVEPSSRHIPWFRMVEEFTALDFTHPKDKLAAFAGIAKVYDSHRKYPDQYLAGMWSSPPLSWGLSWKRGTRLGSHRDILLPRPRPRVAPTWSWASIQSPVRCGPSDSINDWKHDPRITGQHPGFVSGPSLSNVNIVPLGPDEFGELQSASLTLRGSVFDATMYYGKREGTFSRTGAPYNESTLNTSSPTPQPFFLVLRGLEFPLSPDYAFHEPEDEDFVQSGTTVSCLVISHDDAYPPFQLSRICCLVLHPVRLDIEPVHYERIGWAEMELSSSAKDWHLHVSSRRIVLV